MEGHGRRLEPEPDQEQRQAREDHWLPGGTRRGQRRPEPRQVGRPRRAVEQRDPVEEEAAREGAEQEVLQCRLVAGGPGPEGTSEHIERQRHELEGEEDHQEIRPRRHQHHANGGEQDQGVVLPRLHAEVREIPDGQEQHQDGGYPDDDVEEEGEAVHDQHPLEARRGALPEEQGHPHRSAHTEHTRGGEDARSGAPRRRVKEQAGEARHGRDQDRVERRPVEGREPGRHRGAASPDACHTAGAAARLSRTTWRSSVTAVSVTAVNGFG